MTPVATFETIWLPPLYKTLLFLFAKPFVKSEEQFFPYILKVYKNFQWRELQQVEQTFSL